MNDLLQGLKSKMDDELYIAFINGEEEAFNEIMRRYRKSLVSFILRCVGNLESAEDLAQDTFVYLLMHKNEYNFKISLKSYVFLIGKCRAINYLKKQRRAVSVSDEYITELSDKFNMDEELLKNERKKQIYKAMNGLKKEYRIAIYLRDIHNFSYKEVSNILNVTMPQTKVLIYRARKALEKVLRKEGEVC